jgi:L-fuconolactonase
MIDAHFHSWQLARGDYGWLTPEVGSIYRDVAVADWQKLSEPLNITGGILVQAAPTVAETLHLLALAEANPKYSFKIKGLRPMLHDLPDPAWILQPVVQPALAAMEKLGLTFDALIRPVHLQNILIIAQRYPNLSIVIDHCAKPEIALGADAAWQPWANDMAALAKLPNVSCKLSGVLTEAGSYAEPSICKPWIEYILQIFNSDRIIWGSDWPVLELAGHYQSWFESCQSITSNLTASQQDNIFSNNAKRIYKL